MQNTNKDNLKRANEAFKKGMFQEAHDLYLLTIKNDSRLEKFVRFNINLCLKQLGQNVKKNYQNEDDFVKKEKDFKVTEGRLFAKPENLSNKIYENLCASNLFDPLYYKTTYGLSDNINALEHCLNNHNNNPSEKFDSKIYLDKNSDVKRSGKHPLLHYIQYGIKESREIYPISRSINNEEYKKQSKSIDFKIIEGFALNNNKSVLLVAPCT